MRVEGEFDDSRQLEDVVVGSYNGANVYLRDVARVVDTVEERAQETYNNGVEGAMIVVQKQVGVPTLVDISKKVAEALPKLQKNLPSDVKLGVIVDTSDKHSQHHRQFGRNRTVRPFVCSYRGVPLLGTLACHIDYLYYYSAFIDRLVYLPGSHRKYN